MVIKSQAQLKRTNDFLEKLTKQVKEAKIEFSSEEFDFFMSPILEEIEELNQAIDEYQNLGFSSLEVAIDGPLSISQPLEDISDLLAKLRIASGMTQRELAQKIGWKQSNLSRFESDKYTGHSVAKILEYVGALGVILHVIPSLSEEPLEVNRPKLAYQQLEHHERDHWVTTAFESGTTGIDPSKEDIIERLFKRDEIEKLSI